MTTKKSEVNTPKSTKWEQLAKCHSTLGRNEQGEVRITCPEFHDLCAGQKYELNCLCSGKKSHIHIVEKISDYDAGGHTVWTGTVNGETFTELNISELKAFVECTYTRPKASAASPVGKIVTALSTAEKTAREAGENELADLIQKAKVFAQSRDKMLIEEAKKRAEEEAKAKKAEAKTAKADKSADDMSDNALIAQFSKRKGITFEEAKEMLGM